jgi:hypothetical protein
MNSRPETSDRDDRPRTSPPSEENVKEHLEEMTEETAEVMDSARRDVARAKATLHDQILPDSPAAVETAEEPPSH